MKLASVGHTRRQWLFGMAGAALASSQPRNRIYNPQLAAHMSLWLEEAEFRNQHLGDILEEAFLSTEHAGFRRIELTSEFLSPDLRVRTQRMLGRTKLQPAVLFTYGPLYERAAADASRAEVVEIARQMEGFDTRFVNFSPAPRADGRPKTAEELETQAYQLNLMGQDLTKAGMGLMVHHDQNAMEDNAREWRYTRAHTETGLVSFCLDVDWVTRAGLNPLALIDTAGARLRNLHLRNPRMGDYQELLRDGDINMLAISRFLRDSSYDGFLTVELLYDQNTRRQYPVTEALSLSRWYMQEVFGSRPGNPPVDMGPHVRERKS